MRVSPLLHLTYCTNIHPGNGWSEVESNLRRIAPVLKAKLSPSAPFGLGLRLSAREAVELLQGDRLATFRSFLDQHGLYVALINGFPYGPFHGTAVKSQVYAPDWRDAARVRYTLDLIRILADLIPTGTDIEGGVSTVPLSYKAWMPAPAAEDWETIVGHLAEVAETLVRIREEQRTLIHLDIEPEPDCLLEVSQEVIEFFERWLLPLGCRRLADRLGTSVDAARSHLLNHVRVCFDCCHGAVAYEDPAVVFAKFRDAGIQVGRVQLSSALDVSFPPDSSQAAQRAERLGAFVEPVYLHQVVERRNHRLQRFPDLPDALDASTRLPGAQWRIHFHVPLFMREYDGLGSTQDYVRTVLHLAEQASFTRHLEIETYTWDVLPAGLKLEVTDSIEREYRWVLNVLSATC